jgi:hypothetical protein
MNSISTTEQENRYAALVNELQSIAPDAMWIFRGSIYRVDANEFILFLESLANLKKIMLENPDAMLSTLINDFLFKNLILADEMSRETYFTYGANKAGRFVALTLLAKSFTNVIQSTDKNEIMENCALLNASAEKMRTTIDKNNTSAMTLLTLAIVGTAIALVGIAVAVAIPVILLVFGMGILVAPSYCVGIMTLIGGAFMLDINASNLRTKNKIESVACAAVDSASYVKAGFFKRDKPINESVGFLESVELDTLKLKC